MDLAAIHLTRFILEERSIRAAARRATVPASTASSALQRMEAALSVPLIRRAGQALVPTLEAEARLEDLSRLDDKSAQLMALRRGDQPGKPPSVPLSALSRFVQIARSGSIRSAAKSLGLGQPQLTRQLAKLESDLGFPLFERSPAGIHATAEGAAALSLAEEIGMLWANLCAASALRFRQNAATWRLGSIIPFGHESEVAAMLARLAVGWRNARPRQPLFLSSTIADDLVAGLKSRRFDLILLDVANYPRDFEGALVDRSRLALALPGSADAASDLPGLLLSHPLAVPSPRSGLRQVTDRFLADVLSPAERARMTLVEVDSIPVIINLVLHHGYLSVLPEHSVGKIANPPRLLPIGEGYSQSLSLVWPKNALSRQAAATVLALLTRA